MACPADCWALPVWPWQCARTAGDLVTAPAVGIVSGFAATGVNQAAKQLSK